MFSLSFLTSHCFFDANLRIIDKTADRRGHFFPLQATKSFAERKKPLIFAVLKARMAELVDALDSKSSARKGVRVRPPLRVLLIKGLAILLQGLFAFPISLYLTRDKPPSHFPKSHPSKFRLPPSPQYRLRTPFPTGSSLYPAQNTASAGPISPQRFPCLYKHKKPAAFSGRRLKSTIERLSITDNPDNPYSG